MKYGVAKPNKNIQTYTDERDLVYTTDLDYLKEEDSGLEDTDNSGNLTITHNLGYIPAFVVFLADYSDTSTWYTHNMSDDIYATSTQLVINSAMGGIKSKVFYVLFSSEL